MATVILLLTLTYIVFAIFMLVRIMMVERWLGKCLDNISPLCDQDITAGKPWEWRFALLQAHSFSELVWKFWRPVDSFHDMTMLAPQTERVGK